mmetsp:Transcript_123463/g.394389  ORF Transcript_123463/g.394389 Transcript_123463/m.394389 type:complete len:838 (-) Transcript_123463:203-2716(-)
MGLQRVEWLLLVFVVGQLWLGRPRSSLVGGAPPSIDDLAGVQVRHAPRQMASLRSVGKPPHVGGRSLSDALPVVARRAVEKKGASSEQSQELAEPVEQQSLEDSDEEAEIHRLTNNLKALQKKEKQEHEENSRLKGKIEELARKSSDKAEEKRLRERVAELEQSNMTQASAIVHLKKQLDEAPPREGSGHEVSAGEALGTTRLKFKQSFTDAYRLMNHTSHWLPTAMEDKSNELWKTNRLAYYGSMVLTLSLVVALVVSAAWSLTAWTRPKRVTGYELIAEEVDADLPSRWINMSSEVFETKKEEGKHVVYLIPRRRSPSESDGEDCGQEVGQPEEREALGQLTMADDGGVCWDREDGPQELGLLIDDRMLWKDDEWRLCQFTPLSPGDHVMVLDGGKWLDGLVHSRNSLADPNATTYDIYVFGDSIQDIPDSRLSRVDRCDLQKLEISAADRFALLKQAAQYFADVILDSVALIVFLLHYQFKYWLASVFGIILTSLEVSDVLQTALAGRFSLLCDAGTLRRVMSALLGVDFFFEFREAWRRGYATTKFIRFRAAESQMEGLISLGVQVYAFMFSTSYSITQQCLIGASILSSAQGYSSAQGVERAELLEGQMLLTPQQRRDFKTRFSKELMVIQAMRFIEVLCRICTVSCFLITFRPFGILAWGAWEFTGVVAIFMYWDGPLNSSLKEGLAQACWQAFTVDSWITANEAYFQNMKLSEMLSLSQRWPYTRKTTEIVMTLNAFHAVESVMMFVSMYTLRPDKVVDILLCGHRFPVFAIGLCGTPMAWILQAWALRLAKNPALHQFTTRDDAPKRDRSTAQPDQVPGGSGATWCCMT